MKTYLITGEEGFIGSHTAVEVLDAGYDIVIVDDFNNSILKKSKVLRR